MNNKFARLIALFVLLVSITSCFEGRWAKYHRRSHYIHAARKRHYIRFHARHNGDW